jgi:predicted RNase H-like nuclease
MVDLLIGVDCATEAKNVGLALATRHRSGFRVIDARVSSKAVPPMETVEGWIGRNHSVLIALDAPLGWPAPMARALSKHSAGQPIRIPPNGFFRRLTDRQVAERTGKTPLDVGADRIARTAHWALFFLDEVRRGIGEPIPLAWQVPLSHRVMAIEVYPAATLRMLGASLRGYKHPDGVSERHAILELVAGCVDCSAIAAAGPLSADALDAVACVLAAVDFVQGRAVPPSEPDLAEREGWIWVRRRLQPDDQRLGEAGGGLNGV